MSANCCGPAMRPAVDPRWRQALWIALIVNATMFVAEISVGEIADSRSLQADALDFLATPQTTPSPSALRAWRCCGERAPRCLRE